MVNRFVVMVTLACATAVLGARDTRADLGANDDSTIAFLSFDAAAATAPADTTLVDLGGSLGIYHRFIDARLGMTSSSSQLATGQRNAYSLTPTLGGHLGWESSSSIVQGFFGLRLPVQRRSGAELDPRIGWAVGAEGGIRLLACGDQSMTNVCVGVSLAVRYDRHMRDFQMGSAVLPAKSAVASVPVAIFVGTNFNRAPEYY